MPLSHTLAVAALLIGLGIGGALLRRNVWIAWMSVQLTTGGIVLALVGYASRWESSGSSLGLATLVVVIAVLELPVATALIAAWVRARGSADLESASRLRW